MFGALSVQTCEFIFCTLCRILETSAEGDLVDLYYIASPGVKSHDKTLVAFICAMELVQTVMATHDIFAALASGWDTPGALNHIYWSCVDVPIMSSIRKNYLNFTLYSN